MPSVPPFTKAPRYLDGIFLCVVQAGGTALSVTFLYETAPPTIMATPQVPEDIEFEVAMDSRRSLKDLRVRKHGQPVCVVGSGEDRKGKEAVFQHFNVRLAIVKFPDGKILGYDPQDLLLPCEIHEDGEAFFEVRPCVLCNQIFPLTSDEFRAEQERIECPECQP